MLGLMRQKISQHERGFLYRDGDFVAVLEPGKYAFLTLTAKTRIDVVSVREVIHTRKDLDIIARSGELGHEATILEVGEGRRAFVWSDGVFAGVLRPGKYLIWKVLTRIETRVYSVRDAVYSGNDVCEMAESGKLEGHADVIDLAEHERVLVWLNGRLHEVLGPGTHMIWNDAGDVRLEWIDTSEVRVEHKLLAAILDSGKAQGWLDAWIVPQGSVGVVTLDGRIAETLTPGRYAFWRGGVDVKVDVISLKETVVDVLGQDIMTADKVTLRMNAVLAYRISDPVRYLTASGDSAQAAYREAQLALREAIGTRELDALLSDKDSVASEMREQLSKAILAYGIRLESFGIRDVILPGDMKQLLNKVIEAKKASEASLITRREETAAARMQANTAKLMASNPQLLRLRELETLERVASGGNLTVVVGEGGLTERITKLL